MPCSRMPKWKLRPAESPGRRAAAVDQRAGGRRRGRPSRRRARARLGATHCSTLPLARGWRCAVAGRTSGSLRAQPSGSVPAERALELGRELGVRGAVGREALLPRRSQRLRRAARRSQCSRDARRARRSARPRVPAVGLLGQPDLVLAERRAVRVRGVLLRSGRRGAMCVRRMMMRRPRSRPARPRARLAQRVESSRCRRSAGRASRTPRSARPRPR